MGQLRCQMDKWYKVSCWSESRWRGYLSHATQLIQENVRFFCSRFVLKYMGALTNSFWAITRHLEDTGYTSYKPSAPRGSRYYRWNACKDVSWDLWTCMAQECSRINCFNRSKPTYHWEVDHIPTSQLWLAACQVTTTRWLRCICSILGYGTSSRIKKCDFKLIWCITLCRNQ